MTSEQAAGGRSESRREVIRLIEAAIDPSDLFGIDAGQTFRRLARLTHPDANPGSPRAEAAFIKLANLWKGWQISRNRLSQFGPMVASGDIANLYADERGLMKLARSPADNDLLDREATALTRLARACDPDYLPYVPTLIDRVLQLDTKSGFRRRANLIGRLDGFVTLAEVKEVYPAGLDPRDAAWMWRRLLVAIGVAHSAGIVHAAVLPEHVLIHPADHGLVLVDWCYAISEPGQRAVAVPESYVGWYPAEIFNGRPPGADLDIWLATRCMTNLMGDQAPAPLVNFARGCTLTNPDRRPGDAWRLLKELDVALERLYGPRKFRPFVMAT